MDITFKKCPECGSDKIRIVASDFKEPDGLVVSRLERWVCPDCQAIYYDDSAMRRIEAARTPAKSRSRSLVA